MRRTDVGLPGFAQYRLAAREFSQKECLDMLQSTSLGRIALSIKALPAIIPVTFVVLGDAIFAIPDGDSLLAVAVDGAVIAFETDSWNTDLMTGWSVHVVGRATYVEDRDATAQRSPMRTTASGSIIRIETDIVSGRGYVRLR